MRDKKMIIGVTGSFGSGKSTVARMFRSSGVAVIHADEIAHNVLQPATKAYKTLLGIFGRRILQRDKSINRKILAGIVFNDWNLLRRLNKIVHPELIRRLKLKVKTSPEGLVVLDAPLLLEAGLRNLVDKLIVVKTKRKKQIQRLLRKDRALSRQEILKRISTQMSFKEKVRFADFIIDNSGSRRETKKQVERIRRMWWKN